MVKYVLKYGGRAPRRFCGIGMKFLVIEDNEALNAAVVDALGQLGDCDSAYDGEYGYLLAANGSYDLIVLDLMLPKMSGMDLLTKLRTNSNCPLLILTALTDVSHKIEGLKLGADDYMTKPFERDELVARVEAILRRHNNNFKTKYVNGRLELDFAGKILRVDGEDVKLSGKMYDILEYLVRNRNMIISKEQLFNRIWGFDSDTVITVTEVYISNLRKLLEKYGLRDHLRTVKSVGYMWVENPAKEEG